MADLGLHIIIIIITVAHKHKAAGSKMSERKENNVLQQLALAGSEC